MEGIQGGGSAGGRSTGAVNKNGLGLPCGSNLGASRYAQ